jgi:hypothetical protein
MSSEEQLNFYLKTQEGLTVPNCYTETYVAQLDTVDQIIFKENENRIHFDAMARMADGWWDPRIPVL